MTSYWQPVQIDEERSDALKDSHCLILSQLQLGLTV